MKRKHKDDQRGVHVTKMPDNENRANLTDLTIRTSEFAMSTNRNGGMNQSIEEQYDEESKGYDLRKKNDP